jgi:hypothetical protein
MLDSIDVKSLIKQHMPVLGSDDGQLALVDHLEGTDVIKLAKDAEGEHHYIPLTWVSSVDDKVHIDRPSDQAIQQWSRTPELDDADGDETDDDDDDDIATAAPAPEPYVNSVDATTGQPIVHRVLLRKQELEDALVALPAEAIRARLDLELALSTIAELVTGDLANVPSIVAAGMNQWLERNKHLAERAQAPVAEPVAAVVDPVTAPMGQAAPTDS